MSMSFKPDHIALNVTDLERSKRFYASCFDARELSKISPLFAELEIGEVRLHLLQNQKPISDMEGPIAHFCLSVPSLNELEKLASRIRESFPGGPGPSIQEAPPLGKGSHLEQRPPIHVMYFRDPDGILIEIRSYETKSGN